MNTQTQQLLGAFVTLIVMVWPFVRTFAAQLQQALLAKLPANRQAFVEHLADLVVAYVENMSQNAQDANHIKLADRASAAKDALTIIASHYHIALPDTLTRVIVENAVDKLPPSGLSGRNVDTIQPDLPQTTTALGDPLPASSAA